MLFIQCVVVRKSRCHGSVSGITRLSRILGVISVVLFRKKEILSASSTIIIPYS